MADSAQPTLTSLAAQISELSATLAKHIEKQDGPAVSFAADSAIKYDDLTPELFMVRQKLLDAATDIWYLAQGPRDSIMNYVHTVRAAYKPR